MIIETYKPSVDEMWFKAQLLADEATMLYNIPWGGTIPFPKEEWAAWHHYWMDCPETQRYYRYLRFPQSQIYAGEIAYRFDETNGQYLCDVIVLAKYRNQGIGTAGLQLLCEAARTNGIPVLYDSIGAQNPSLSLFLKNGFEIVDRSDETVMIRKQLNG